ncbi:hypothetical protein HELRODRAFT_152821, partial [Helobdella robusta]|uniref:Uncharacterized protein n=1 Tax=Helobdella robusta TaxID=6412 RepID=T1EKX2_HELRO
QIRCKLSGHEIPCRLDAIEQYVSGKKYQKLSKESLMDLSQYKDHIIPSTKPNQEHLLFCKLTCRHINNTVDGIQNHIKGKKFQRAFRRWTECQANGVKFIP